jgi:hypothetical protein
MCDTASLVIDILPSSGITITGLDASEVSCFGSANGSIAIEAAGLGQLTYNWSNGLVGSSIENLSGGVYSVVISSSENCVASQSAEFIITEPQQLSATSDINDGNGDGIGSGDEIVLDITGGFGNYDIAWETSFGTNGQGNNFAITDDGSYTYSITDENGCTLEETIAITSVEDYLAADQLLVYPNPLGSNEQLTFSCAGNIESLTIHDAQGRLISHLQPQSGTQGIDTTSWTSGLYHYAVSIHGQIQTGTIVKP